MQSAWGAGERVASSHLTGSWLWSRHKDLCSSYNTPGKCCYWQSMMGKLRHGAIQGLRAPRLEPPRPHLPSHGMKMEGSLRGREGARTVSLRPSKPNKPGGLDLNSFSVTSNVINCDRPVTAPHSPVYFLMKTPKRVTGGKLPMGHLGTQCPLRLWLGRPS